MDKKEEKQEQEDVIETASATTSSDNSNSGPFAYIITSITVGVAILFSILASGCVSMIIATSGMDYSSMGQGYTGPSAPLDYEDYYDQELEEMLEQLYGGNQYGTQGQQTRDETGTADVSEVLSYDLAIYGSTIDGEVSASSYAGVPNAVRTFVRDVLAKDKEYSSSIVQSFHDAEVDDAKRAESLKTAKETCAKAREAINAVEIPAIEHDEQGTGKDALGTAKNEAIHRWEQVEAEVNLLMSGDSIEKKKLWEVDDNISDTTDKAADLFTESMETVANLK